ncbi:MAG: twitching motility protein PilT [Deltaproteobacteria bacterium RIFOXYD12_FULL_55_16]|nr:MAG: twitching motility protein PilT [Deltaproteobacteria bacterium RIFOXYD12_FULL_55_16]
MKLLLDTHTLLWWFTDDPKLSPAAREAILNESNEIFVSAASAWEIAAKQRIGKLNDLPGLSSRFGELVAADGFSHLPVNYLHSLRAGAYSLAHRDPFDRMLAAQSEIEFLALVTIDPAFTLFGTDTFW